ncbi:MAG: amidotransferase [Kordiimonas sp.]|nr:amidotransferase [Kordiimonas sp.]
MRVHALYHVPFEGLANISNWLDQRAAVFTETYTYEEGASFPPAEDIDLLIVMGGPMGVYDHDKHPWLVTEKSFIKNVISAGKKVLGICLGAQLIADVLGAEVRPHPQKEIGWFPVYKTSDAQRRAHHSELVSILPDEFMAFHWHGDRFAIPKGATHLFTSDICAPQGFLFNDNVLGLQFHLETTPDSLQALIEHCGKELTDAPSIQLAPVMLDNIALCQPANRLMAKILDKLMGIE